jgi:hypothetical protein
MDYRLPLQALALGLTLASMPGVHAQTIPPGGTPSLMLPPSGLANQSPRLNNSTPPLANSDAALANQRAGLPFNATGNPALAPPPLSAPVLRPGVVRR